VTAIEKNTFAHYAKVLFILDSIYSIDFSQFWLRLNIIIVHTFLTYYMKHCYIYFPKLNFLISQIAPEPFSININLLIPHSCESHKSVSWSCFQPRYSWFMSS